MTAAMPSPQVTEFATGFQRTRIHSLPDGVVHWERAPGPNNRTPFRQTPAWFRARAAAACDRRIRFATPAVDSARHRVWKVHGRRSAAQLLLADDEPADQVPEVFRDIGRALRALHTHPLGTEEAAQAGPAPGPARLAAWLATGRGPRAAGGFRHTLRTQLGPSRWDSLQQMAEQALAPGPEALPLHGWPSMGSLVLPDDEGALPACVVLSGAEAAYGRPELDLGCVIGELVEFRMVAERDGRSRPVLDELRDLLLAGYGHEWDAAFLASSAVVRLATHAHDFAAYIGWHPDLHLYIPMLVELLDSDGAAALPRDLPAADTSAEHTELH